MTKEPKINKNLGGKGETLNFSSAFAGDYGFTRGGMRKIASADFTKRGKPRKYADEPAEVRHETWRTKAGHKRYHGLARGVSLFKAKGFKEDCEKNFLNTDTHRLHTDTHRFFLRNNLCKSELNLRKSVFKRFLQGSLKKWMSAIIALIFLSNIALPAYASDFIYRPGNYGDKGSLTMYLTGGLAGAATDIAIIVDPIIGTTISVASDVTGAILYRYFYSIQGMPVIKDVPILGDISVGQLASMVVGIGAGYAAGYAAGAIEKAISGAAASTAPPVVSSLVSTTATVASTASNSFIKAIIDALLAPVKWVAKLLAKSVKAILHPRQTLSALAKFFYKIFIKPLIVKPAVSLWKAITHPLNSAKGLFNRFIQPAYKNLIEPLIVRPLTSLGKAIIHPWQALKSLGNYAFNQFKSLLHNINHPGDWLNAKRAAAKAIRSKTIEYGKNGEWDKALVNMFADISIATVRLGISERIRHKLEKKGWSETLARTAGEAASTYATMFVAPIILRAYGAPFGWYVTAQGGYGDKFGAQIDQLDELNNQIADAAKQNPEVREYQKLALQDDSQLSETQLARKQELENKLGNVLQPVKDYIAVVKYLNEQGSADAMRDIQGRNINQMNILQSGFEVMRSIGPALLVSSVARIAALKFLLNYRDYYGSDKKKIYQAMRKLALADAIASVSAGIASNIDGFGSWWAGTKKKEYAEVNPEGKAEDKTQSIEGVQEAGNKIVDKNNAYLLTRENQGNLPKFKLFKAVELPDNPFRSRSEDATTWASKYYLPSLLVNEAGQALSQILWAKIAVNNRIENEPIGELGHLAMSTATAGLINAAFRQDPGKRAVSNGIKYTQEGAPEGEKPLTQAEFEGRYKAEDGWERIPELKDRKATVTVRNKEGEQIVFNIEEDNQVKDTRPYKEVLTDVDANGFLTNKDSPSVVDRFQIDQAIAKGNYELINESKEQGKSTIWVLDQEGKGHLFVEEEKDKFSAGKLLSATNQEFYNRFNLAILASSPYTFPIPNAGIGAFQAEQNNQRIFIQHVSAMMNGASPEQALASRLTSNMNYQANQVFAEALTGALSPLWLGAGNGYQPLRDKFKYGTYASFDKGLEVLKKRELEPLNADLSTDSEQKGRLTAEDSDLPGLLAQRQGYDEKLKKPSAERVEKTKALAEKQSELESLKDKIREENSGSTKEITSSKIGYSPEQSAAVEALENSAAQLMLKIDRLNNQITELTNQSQLIQRRIDNVAEIVLPYMVKQGEKTLPTMQEISDHRLTFEQETVAIKKIEENRQAAADTLTAQIEETQTKITAIESMPDSGSLINAMRLANILGRPVNLSDIIVGGFGSLYENWSRTVSPGDWKKPVVKASIEAFNKTNILMSEDKEQQADRALEQGVTEGYRIDRTVVYSGVAQPRVVYGNPILNSANMSFITKAVNEATGLKEEIGDDQVRALQAKFSKQLPQGEENLSKARTAILELKKGIAIFAPERSLLQNTVLDELGRPQETFYYGQEFRGGSWQPSKIDMSTKYYFGPFGLAMAETKDYSQISLPSNWEQQEISPERKETKEVSPATEERKETIIEKSERKATVVVKPVEPEKKVLNPHLLEEELPQLSFASAGIDERGLGASAVHSLAKPQDKQALARLKTQLHIDSRGVMHNRQGNPVATVRETSDRLIITPNAPSLKAGIVQKSSEGKSPDLMVTIPAKPREMPIPPRTKVVTVPVTTTREITIPAVAAQTKEITIPAQTKDKPFSVGPNTTYDIELYAIGKGSSPYSGPSYHATYADIKSGPYLDASAHYSLRSSQDMFNEVVTDLIQKKFALDAQYGASESPLTEEQRQSRYKKELKQEIEKLKKLGISEEEILKTIASMSEASFDYYVKLQKDNALAGTPPLSPQDQLKNWAAQNFNSEQVNQALAKKESEIQANLGPNLAEVPEVHFSEYNKNQSGKTYTQPTWSIKQGLDLTPEADNPKLSELRKRQQALEEILLRLKNNLNAQAGDIGIPSSDESVNEQNRQENIQAFKDELASVNAQIGDLTSYKLTERFSRIQPSIYNTAAINSEIKQAKARAEKKGDTQYEDFLTDLSGFQKAGSQETYVMAPTDGALSAMYRYTTRLHQKGQEDITLSGLGLDDVIPLADVLKGDFKVQAVDLSNKAGPATAVVSDRDSVLRGLDNRRLALEEILSRYENNQARRQDIGIPSSDSRVREKINNQDIESYRKELENVNQQIEALKREGEISSTLDKFEIPAQPTETQEPTTDRSAVLAPPEELRAPSSKPTLEKDGFEEIPEHEILGPYKPAGLDVSPVLAPAKAKRATPPKPTQPQVSTQYDAPIGPMPQEVAPEPAAVETETPESKPVAYGPPAPTEAEWAQMRAAAEARQKAETPAPPVAPPSAVKAETPESKPVIYGPPAPTPEQWAQMRAAAEARQKAETPAPPVTPPSAVQKVELTRPESGPKKPQPASTSTKAQADLAAQLQRMAGERSSETDDIALLRRTISTTAQTDQTRITGASQNKSVKSARRGITSSPSSTSRQSASVARQRAEAASRAERVRKTAEALTQLQLLDAAQTGTTAWEDDEVSRPGDGSALSGLPTINMDAIYKMESSCGTDPQACVENKYGVLGPWQIGRGMWKDLQDTYPKQFGDIPFEQGALDPEISKEAAKKAFSINASYLKDSGMPVTEDTLVAAYFGGIGTVVNAGGVTDNYPTKTRAYVRKYLRRAYVEAATGPASISVDSAPAIPATAGATTITPVAPVNVIPAAPSGSTTAGSDITDLGGHIQHYNRVVTDLPVGEYEKYKDAVRATAESKPAAQVGLPSSVEPKPVIYGPPAPTSEQLAQMRAAAAEAKQKKVPEVVPHQYDKPIGPALPPAAMPLSSREKPTTVDLEDIAITRDRYVLGNIDGVLVHEDRDKIYTYSGREIGEKSSLLDKINPSPFVSSIEGVKPSPELVKMLEDGELNINYLFGSDKAYLASVMGKNFDIHGSDHHGGYGEHYEQLKREGKNGFDREFTMQYDGRPIAVKLHVALTFKDWLTHFRDPEGKYKTDWSHIDSHGRWGLGPQGDLDECAAGVCNKGYTYTIPWDDLIKPSEYRALFNNPNFKVTTNPDSSVTVTDKVGFKQQYSDIRESYGSQFLTLATCKSEDFWDSLTLYGKSPKTLVGFVTNTEATSTNAFFDIYASLLSGHSFEAIVKTLNRHQHAVDPFFGGGEWELRNYNKDVKK